MERSHPLDLTASAVRAFMPVAYMAAALGSVAALLLLVAQAYRWHPALADLAAVALFVLAYWISPYLHEFGHAAVARMFGATSVRIIRGNIRGMHAMQCEGDLGGPAAVALVLLAGPFATLGCATLLVPMPLPFSIRIAWFAALFLRTLEEVTLAEGSDLSRFIALQIEAVDRTLHRGVEILRAKNITVRIGDRTLVEDATFEVRTGDIVGILGANGAGKSTLLEVLAGLRKPAEGGFEIADGARRGFGPGKSLFLPSATVGEMLNYFSVQSGSPRDRSVEERFGLSDFAFTRISNASSGELQRLSLAIALSQRADILILDEPETALDPAGRTVVRALLRERAARGKACVLATHFVADALDFCTHLAVIDRGKIVRFGPVESFGDLRATAHRLTLWLRSDAAQIELPAAVVRDADDPAGLRARAVGTVQELVGIASQLGGAIDRFELESNTL